MLGITVCIFTEVSFRFCPSGLFLFSLGTVPTNVIGCTQVFEGAVVIGYMQVFEFGSRDEMTGNLVQVLDLTDRNINLIDS